MEVSVSNQMYVFAVMLLCGACAGLLFDLMRGLRRCFGANMIVTSVEDILFWLAISAGIYAVIFVCNYGQLRWHEIIGLILGSVIYFLTLSRAVLRLFDVIFRIFTKIFQIIFKIVLTPLFFLYKMIKRPFYCVLRMLRSMARRGDRGARRVGGKIRGGLRRFWLVFRKS